MRVAPLLFALATTAPGCLTPQAGRAEGILLEATFGTHWQAGAARDALANLGWNATSVNESGFDARLPNGDLAQAQAYEFGFRLALAHPFATSEIIQRSNATAAYEAAMQRAPEYEPQLVSELAAFERATGWTHQGTTRTSCLCI